MKKLVASLCMLALAGLSVPETAPATGEGLPKGWLPELLNDGSPYDKDVKAFRAKFLKAAAKAPTPLEGCWAVDDEELRVDGEANRTIEARGEAFYASWGEPETTFPQAPCRTPPLPSPASSKASQPSPPTSSPKTSANPSTTSAPSPAKSPPTRSSARFSGNSASASRILSLTT